MIQLNRILRLLSGSRFQIAPARIAPAIALLVSIAAVFANPASAQDRVDSACVQIERTLPPQGIEIADQDRVRWLQELDAIDKQAVALSADKVADVTVLTKACRLAIEFRELYQPKDANKVDRLIKLAQARLEQLRTTGLDWSKDSARQVRGFISAVDGSAQPLGLVLPEGWNTSKKPVPLYVWLHGRGDKSTDLHFICERLDKNGEVVPEGAIVVHPFGRQCVGYKSAGETDVMEAIDFVCKNYPVDKDRIVLMGFSMGGAGVWHLAAHYADRFIAASPGAGFAETSRYQNLKPEKFPPQYEQVLWSIYDVPGYTRNLFNFPVVAYSGELDKQMQAAKVMEEAFSAEGQKLTHLIGPGMGHKYHPDTLKEILSRLAEAQASARQTTQKQLWLQTKHWRYSSRDWITIDGLRSAYSDTRADAQLDGDTWSIDTKNVSRLSLNLAAASAPRGKLVVDGQLIALPEKRLISDPSNKSSAGSASSLLLTNSVGRWQTVASWSPLRKHPKMSGPIDDAFIDPFLVVMPSGEAAQPRVQQWVRCESVGFIDRWRSLFRGEPRVKLDKDVTADDMQRYHLILWGDAQSNSVIASTLAALNSTDPKLNDAKFEKIEWKEESVRIGDHRFDADTHVPAFIYPNPLALDRYVVINSGPTFRQAHDRTNSLQNPHLPDWNIISLDTLPNESTPGRIAKCGFFDDGWQVDPKQTW